MRSPLQRKQYVVPPDMCVSERVSSCSLSQCVRVCVEVGGSGSDSDSGSVGSC